MAGAEIDLLLERGDRRVAEEVKTSRGDQPRAVRAMEDAMDDVGANRGWIIDQTSGIDQVTDRIARAGFADVLTGTPD